MKYKGEQIMITEFRHKAGSLCNLGTPDAPISSNDPI